MCPLRLARPRVLDMTMKIGATGAVPPTQCTACDKPIDAATPVDDAEELAARPSAGDATVCLGCGHIMIYAADLSLRDPTEEEMAEIAGDRRIVAINKWRGKL
jgi:hypothetical protein